MNRLLTLFILPALLACQVATAENKDLPNVLLIGDSISIGYTKPVQKLMKGEANVIHHKGNAGPTSNGLAKLDSWLGDTKWDIIHFNWGLHDLCYRHPDSKVQGKRDKVNGTIMVPLDDYEKNLETLVQRLKKTKATLIWATTTVVPEGEAGRHVGDEIKYNAVAAKIMNENGIAINDLHAEVLRLGKPDRPNVHDTGNLSTKVSESILAALKTRKQL